MENSIQGLVIFLFTPCPTYHLLWHFWSATIRCYYEVNYSMSPNTHASFTDTVNIRLLPHTHSSWCLCTLICTSQTLIDPHYFNMKIITTWNFSHGSNIQQLPTTLYGSLSLQLCVFLPSPPSTLDQALQGLPTITQLAQHLPSHHRCARKHHFTSFFSFFSSSVLFWFFFSFPNGNFEVNWCCLFRANSSKHKG